MPANPNLVVYTLDSGHYKPFGTDPARVAAESFKRVGFKAKGKYYHWLDTLPEYMQRRWGEKANTMVLRRIGLKYDDPI